jgi:4'-phosphopantetheinyl transferase
VSASIAIPEFQSAASRSELRPGEVHLWMTPLDRVCGADDPPLNADEWVQAGHYHHAIDRLRYIASRAAMQRILGLYVPDSQASLRFTHNEFGKPFLAGSLLRFNLSHSDGLMLLAVTHGREVGIDLEAVRESISFEMLSDHYFSPEEQWELRITPESQRMAKFFELWTRADAQIKARGIELRRSVKFDDPDRFTVCSFEPMKGFIAALVVEGRDIEVSCWRWPE